LGRTKRFCLEFYAGFGIHYRKGTLVNQPASTEYYLNNPPGYIDMEISKGILPVVPAGIKVAWRI